MGGCTIWIYAHTRGTICDQKSETEVKKNKIVKIQGVKRYLTLKNKDESALEAVNRSDKSLVLNHENHARGVCFNP
jgi:hypothetical protein